MKPKYKSPEYKSIGKNFHPKHILKKIKGDAKFCADIKFKNSIALKALRSSKHHAVIENIDISKAMKIPGVIKIFRAKDIPGKNLIGILNKDQPLLIDDKVRSKADPIALIAAKTDNIALKALKKIHVTYKELKPIFSIKDALLKDAYPIHKTGNNLFTSKVKKGDIKKGFKNCFSIIKNQYKTHAVEHNYIEPDAGAGYVDKDGTLVIYASTQNPHYDHQELASLLNLEHEKIRIIQAVTGGGFGSKLDLNVQGFIGLGLYYLKKPVHYIYTQEEAKTTIINAIIKIYSQLNIRIFLCAPTGRAAKKMKEATNHEALTIHRLLKYSIQQKGFQKNEKNLLSCDLLIVDEASMIDTLLMHHLLKAVPDTCSLILVGDVNQLPSIGAGNVLNDIISSNAFNVIKLNTIFRQAKKSMIIVNAHKINNGFFPVLNTNKYNNDFFFIEKQEPEEIVNTITELVKNRIPKKFGFNPINDIQVITPMHKGTTGAGNLNHQLQQSLNPNKEGIKKGIFEFKVSDKVMQIRNNYNKNIYNGDIGTIKKINFADQNMIINFDFNDIEYDFNDLDEIVLAYAISVHKSQGSEYPVVIIPVTTQHYILLQKNLIYTALTRGKKLVIMIGTKKALAMAIKNKKSSKRHTGLENRLNELT